MARSLRGSLSLSYLLNLLLLNILHLLARPSQLLGLRGQNLVFSLDLILKLLDPIVHNFRAYSCLFYDLCRIFLHLFQSFKRLHLLSEGLLDLLIRTIDGRLHLFAVLAQLSDLIFRLSRLSRGFIDLILVLVLDLGYFALMLALLLLFVIKLHLQVLHLSLKVFFLTFAIFLVQFISDFALNFVV